MPRARVEAVRGGRQPITKAKLEAGRAELAGELLQHADTRRPRTWGECRELDRPCPWVACRHHLYLDINPESGSIKINFPDREPWELVHTCSLDVAEGGRHELERVGEIMNLTRERIRQVEVRSLIKLKAALAEQEKHV